jgi:GMP synthase-like glutamine amidotransferase
VKTLTVLQHTSAEYLGNIEDHLEGRRIRFRYSRPFATGGRVPKAGQSLDGLVLLGGGPWGSAGGRNVPTLIEELTLTKAALAKGVPVLGIGLGAQLLSIMTGGTVEQTELRFEVDEARRLDAQALGGLLPERYPLVIYGRDRPIPPPDARILAVDSAGRPALFQVGENALGFTGHPGVKPAIVEDLIMEFDEAPDDPGPTLARLRDVQPALEDALVPIMAGVVKLFRWME